MKDWKKKLQEILSRGSGRSPEADLQDSRRRIAGFFEDTVLPAFNDLKAELKQHGRDVEITKTPTQATLVVYKDNQEEFSYAVHAHAYHRMTFAFPEIARGDEPRVYRVDVTPHERPAEHHKMAEFTRSDIIEDFLEEYRKWMGW